MNTYPAPPATPRRMAAKPAQSRPGPRRLRGVHAGAGAEVVFGKGGGGVDMKPIASADSFFFGCPGSGRYANSSINSDGDMRGPIAPRRGASEGRGSSPNDSSVRSASDVNDVSGSSVP